MCSDFETSPEEVRLEWYKKREELLRTESSESIPCHWMRLMCSDLETSPEEVRLEWYEKHKGLLRTEPSASTSCHWVRLMVSDPEVSAEEARLKFYREQGARRKERCCREGPASVALGNIF